MRVHKHLLKEGMNTIKGVSKLVYLDFQGTKLYGWFITQPQDQLEEYEVYIALTGEQVPDEYQYVTSTQLFAGNGYYVIHAFD
jgi:hypothetical protein